MTPQGVELSLSPTNTDASSCKIFYGNKVEKISNNDFQIPAQSLIFSEIIYPSLTLFANSFQFEGFTLWSVEPQVLNHQQFIENQQFGFDIIEALFFHLSRYEEYHAPNFERDWNDELPAEKHFLVQNRLNHQAVVDQLVHCFLESLGFEMEKKKTTFRLSHDIDVLQKYPDSWASLRAVGSAAWHQKTFHAVKKIIVAWYQTKHRKSKDPYDSFDYLLTNLAIEKVIYFMAGGQTKFDNFYDIEDVETQKIIQRAIESGYRIGLHPSYDCYLREDLFLSEKAKLEAVVGQKIEAVRMHYLRFRFPKTIEIMDKCGIKEDSTMGYQNLFGFRCGTGFAYRLFNFETKKSADFWETPMVIMDGGLLEEAEYDIALAKSILDKFLAQNMFLTRITFNFHNSIFNPARVNCKELKDFYLEILNRVG